MPAAPAPVRALRAAITFLTRIPWPAPADEPYEPADLAMGTVWFPVVGAIVGAIGAVVLRFGMAIWPTPIAVVLAVGATVLATGAFHEDALADAADGFGGGWTREQVLAIMKDSRVGSYGVIAVVLVVAAKLAALDAIAGVDRADAVRALVAAHTIARWSSLPLIARYPYVREGAGAGKPVAGQVTTGRLLAGTALAIAILAATIGRRTLAVSGAALVVTGLAGWYSARRIGGITGDCLGAANQCVELATYLVLAAAPHPS